MSDMNNIGFGDRAGSRIGPDCGEGENRRSRLEQEDAVIVGDGDTPVPVVKNDLASKFDKLMRKLVNNADTWDSLGNHRIICRGHIFLQPIRFWWWLFMFATLVVGITFIYEYIANVETYSIWSAVFGLMFFGLTIVSTWKTLFADPGIIKRPNIRYAILNLKRVQQLMSDGSAPVVPIKIGKKLVPHGYCFKCHVFRPPYSGHCSFCNCCIRDWNLHCDLTGGCIGGGNWLWSQIMGFAYMGFYMYMFVTGTMTAASHYQGLVPGFNSAPDSESELGNSEGQMATPPQFFIAGSLVLMEVFLVLFVILSLSCALYWTPLSEQDKKALANTDRFPSVKIQDVPISVIEISDKPQYPEGYPPEKEEHTDDVVSAFTATTGESAVAEEGTITLEMRPPLLPPTREPPPEEEPPFLFL